MMPPVAGGTYILLVTLPVQTSINVGRLGPHAFVAGFYAYIGSAHGSGGLSARLGRYVSGPARKHWHIDHLLEHGEVVGALHRVEQRRLECTWAEWCKVRADAPVLGFGSSDCRCPSHLFFVGEAEAAHEMIRDAGRELKAVYISEGDDGS